MISFATFFDKPQASVQKSEGFGSSGELDVFASEAEKGKAQRELDEFYEKLRSWRE